MILKFIYTIFIGVLFATLVGVGIAAFYPQPKAPEFPTTMRFAPDQNASDAATKKFEAEQIRYDSTYKEFHKKEQIYNRDVSIISLVFAIAALVVSLTLFKSLLLIADGLLLGGVLTLMYSIIRGFAAEDNMFRFIVVAVGFVVAIIIGYIKFAKPSQTKK